LTQSIFEEFEVLEITREDRQSFCAQVCVNVVAEISLKLIVNGDELASLLCMNQHHKPLALGFLFNEGVIQSMDDISGIVYSQGLQAVNVDLKPGIAVHRSGQIRSITSGCGQCISYVNPQNNLLQYNESTQIFKFEEILDMMKRFMHQSDLFRDVGGVHSVLFYTPEFELLVEDIGRHNCVDKVAGLLLQNQNMERAATGCLFISGRVSSEIVTKAIRLGIPVIVSRSTPTSAAIRFAQEYGITLMGYVRGEKATIYTGQQRVRLL